MADLNLDLDPCITANGAAGASGYSQIKRSGILFAGHVLAYELVHGKVPQGLHVMHGCNNKMCVNPRHLTTGTPKQNAMDAARDGLTPRGEEHGNAKLSNSDVVRIRELLAVGRRGTAAELASTYGVSESLISRIKKGIKWRT